MKIEHILYGVGSFSAICAVIYFTMEYIAYLSYLEKVSILTFLTVLFLALGYHFREEAD
ncbi:MAG: hypothetical protein SVJ22_09625 [Halobacteriota archaeon]|nr:hypothetical protein [Halobacteriota archaeon]MDY6932158.1 hypothetical protein [Halobacteriota archaeon]